MNCTLENEITKKWLQDHPYDPTKELPQGWEFIFGRCGRFLKYDSIEHAERKNISTVNNLPFGYCNKEWENLKANLQLGDEIWRYGGSYGEAILHVREGSIIKNITLSCY